MIAQWMPTGYLDAIRFIKSLVFVYWILLPILYFLKGRPYTAHRKDPGNLCLSVYHDFIEIPFNNSSTLTQTHTPDEFI